MNETLAILDRVNAFYSASFSQLVQYTTALLAFVGLVIPLFLSYLQARQTRKEKDFLERIIQQRLQTERDHLKREIRVELDQAHKEIRDALEEASKGLRADLNNARLTLEAGVLHVQANHSFDSRRYERAYHSAIRAALNQIATQDERNLHTALDVAMDCLAQMDQSHFLDEEIAHDSDALVRSLTAYNTKGGYTASLKNLKGRLAEARNRQTPADPIAAM